MTFGKCQVSFEFKALEATTGGDLSRIIGCLRCFSDYFKRSYPSPIDFPGRIELADFPIK